MTKQKKIKKLPLEKTMKMASLPVLSEHEILSAKKRVWNQIDAEVKSHESKKNHEVKQSSRPWFLQFKTYGYSFATLSVCVLIAVGSFSVYSQLLQKNTPTESTNRVYDAKAQLQNGVQALAASRFQELNGVTFEQFKEALTEEKPTTTNTNSAVEPSPTNIVKIDETKGQQIVETLKAKDIPTFISKKSLEINNKDLFAKSDLYNEVYSNLGTKDFVITTSTRPNFYKQSIQFEGKIVNLIDETPSFSLEYKGGKYAIKQVYSENKVQIAGVDSNGNSYFNPDTQVLKEILTNPDADLTGAESSIITATIEDKTNNSKLVYTLDSETLNIQNQEFWIGENLVYTLKTDEIRKIDAGPNSIDTDFGVPELTEKNIEIKEINSDENLDELTLQKSSFASFVDNYLTLSFDQSESQISTYNLYDFTNEKNQTFKNYYNLKYSADFAPNAQLSVNSLNLDKDLVAEQKTDKYLISIYPKNFDYNVDSFENTKIKLDSKEISAYVQERDTSRNIVFVMGDYKYIISEKTNADNQELTFTSIDKNFAAKIDKYISDKESSLPKLQEVKITDLTDEQQKLIQDYAKTNKLEIKNIYTFIKNSENSKCEDFYLDKFNDNYLNCLVESNNGLVVVLNDTSNTSSQKNIYYFIKSGLDQKFIDELKDNNFKVEKVEEYLLIYS